MGSGVDPQAASPSRSGNTALNARATIRRASYAFGSHPFATSKFAGNQRILSIFVKFCATRRCFIKRPEKKCG